MNLLEFNNEVMKALEILESVGVTPTSFSIEKAKHLELRLSLERAGIKTVPDEPFYIGGVACSIHGESYH